MFINPKANVFKLISLNYRKFQSLLDEEFKNLNISRGDYPFLLNLYHSEEYLNQNQLSKNLNVDRAHTNRYIKKLVAAGYIENIKNEGNSKQYCLRLTPAGIEISKKIIIILENSANNLLQNMNDTSINDLNTLLESVYLCEES